MSTSPATCPWFAEVAGITVYGDDHVAGIVSENRFVLGGNVIKELFHLIECVDSGFRQLGGYGTDGTQEGRVDGSSKEEEFPTYLLDEFFAFLV